MKRNRKHIDTRLGHLGLDPFDNYGIPNPPIYRTSTILSSSFAQHRGEEAKPYSYGRTGTPTSAAFEKAVADIYDAECCISAPSGLAALTTALLAFTKAGKPYVVSRYAIWVNAPVCYAHVARYGR